MVQTHKGFSHTIRIQEPLNTCASHSKSSYSYKIICPNTILSLKPQPSRTLKSSMATRLVVRARSSPRHESTNPRGSIYTTIREVGLKIPYYRRHSGSQFPNGSVCTISRVAFGAIAIASPCPQKGPKSLALRPKPSNLKPRIRSPKS